VVAGVLTLPPAIADSHQQVGDDHADPVVPTAGFEHLSMCGVVTEKGDLGHGHTQDGGAGQLPPRVADPHEGSHPDGQQNDSADQLGPVVAVAAAHQSHFVHGTG
jgi:hypothetical protein